jgi:hypothetical protein
MTWNSWTPHRRAQHEQTWAVDCGARLRGLLGLRDGALVRVLRTRPRSRTFSEVPIAAGLRRSVRWAVLLCAAQD